MQWRESLHPTCKWGFFLLSLLLPTGAHQQASRVRSYWATDPGEQPHSEAMANGKKTGSEQLSPGHQAGARQSLRTCRKALSIPTHFHPFCSLSSSSSTCRWPWRPRPPTFQWVSPVAMAGARGWKWAASLVPRSLYSLVQQVQQEQGQALNLVIFTTICSMWSSSSLTHHNHPLIRVLMFLPFHLLESDVQRHMVICPRLPAWWQDNQDATFQLRHLCRRVTRALSPGSWMHTS